MGMIGLYEKAMPTNFSWADRFACVQTLGFDFLELSIDESDLRLRRLDWMKDERQAIRRLMVEYNLPILSLCLSAHRRYPLGAEDESTQERAYDILVKAVDLASDLGIRTIQLAGYDVYYQPKSVTTRENFVRNLQHAVNYAASKGVILSMEIMDDPFMSSIDCYLTIKQQIKSPYLQVYPDIGNLCAWPDNDVAAQLERGIEHITQIHLKETKRPTDLQPAQFKCVPFGTGDVDMYGCLKTLQRLNYNGPMVIEMWSEESKDPKDPMAEIEAALAYLVPIFDALGITHRFGEYRINHNDLN